MAMSLSPYISYNGTAREAMTFYKGVFGGEITFSTYGEFDDTLDGHAAMRIMHAELITDADFILLGSDTPDGAEFDPSTRISIAIFGNEEATMAKYYESLLAAGGNTKMPLEKAPWGDSFGMVTDKFGVEWMFNISGVNHSDYHRPDHN